MLLAGDDLTRESVAEIVERLGERGREELDAPDAELRATYELRYAGQAFELAIEGELEPDPDELRRDFDAAHDERYGYDDPDAELELVTVRVTAALPGTDPRETEPRGRRGARHARAALRRRARERRRCSARAARRSTARRSSSCPARRWSCRPAGGPRAAATPW